MKLNLVYIGIGSSKGDKKKYIEDSFYQICKLGINGKISSLYYSDPWGGVAKNQFINATCSLETKYTSIELLNLLQKIENKYNRVRNIKWDDRTIDLDILLFNKDKINTEILSVPHPYMWEREFVSLPLIELIGKERYDNLKKYYSISSKSIL
jgi:2-amino-4-hydroxy-6-hydroxymethyldihydropteridine diphosphokinase